MEDCIFCKIVNNEIPSKKRYEDEKFLAFDDINPKAKNHILIIPKKHITSFHQIKDEEDKQLIKWAFDIAWILTEELWLNWCNIIINSWKNHWQEVNHFHIHLISNSD